MKKFANKICEHKNLILIITGILMALSFIGMNLTKVNYDILVYLPEDIETIKGQNILTDDFEMGSYSVAVAKNMSSKEIMNIEDKIKNVKGVNKVVSLYDAVGVIPIDMLPESVTKYLHSDDEDIFLITFAGGTSSEETINAVKEIRNLTSDKIKLGGMSSMVLDTMNLSNEEIVIYIIIAVILCIVVLELSLDSYIVPVLLLANIGIAILINMGTNIFFGEISYITKALVAVLQLGVTTDFSIFLYNCFEKKKELYKSKEEAMSSAIKETFTSVIGSSLTTIAGFLVLCTMSLTLGKDLGIVMAKGVLIGLISTLLLFPALLLTFDKLIFRKKGNDNMKNVKNKKIVSAALLSLLISLPLNASALTKDETVYAHLNENGETKNIIVSEILKNNEGKNEIIDYSTLENIINKNGNETYTLDKNKLTWMSNGNDIYYEGKYQKNLPISMNITYKLNGKKVSAKDILGQSGKVEITINYKNSSKRAINVNGKTANIYTPFMIMYAAMLDSTYNKNVTINNGKVVSNGNKDVVVGLSIPGLRESLNINEINLDSLVITYDTTKFEVPTMYNIVSNKLISDGNFNLSKISTIYDKVGDLQEGIDKINEGSQELSDGLTLLKNTLTSSLSALDSSSDALTSSEVSYIKETAVNNVLNQMKENIITDENGNVLGSKDENVNTIVTNSVKKATLNYLTSINETENANTYLTIMTKMQNNIDLTDEEKVFAYTHKDTLTILGIVVNASEVSAKDVSTNISTYVAKTVAGSTAESVATTVANEVKNAALESTKKSLTELLSAITKLDDGASLLNNGITKYNNEGISIITSLVNDNVKEYEIRLNELNKLAKEYKTIEDKHLSNNDETKFIMVVDGEKQKDTVKENTTKETKTSLWTKIKNLFKKEN